MKNNFFQNDYMSVNIVKSYKQLLDINKGLKNI